MKNRRFSQSRQNATKLLAAHRSFVCLPSIEYENALTSGSPPINSLLLAKRSVFRKHTAIFVSEAKAEGPNTPVHCPLSLGRVSGVLRGQEDAWSMRVEAVVAQASVTTIHVDTSRDLPGQKSIPAENGSSARYVSATIPMQRPQSCSMGTIDSGHLTVSEPGASDESGSRSHDNNFLLDGLITTPTCPTC
jgi:hypothetical protein